MRSTKGKKQSDNELRKTVGVDFGKGLSEEISKKIKSEEIVAIQQYHYQQGEDKKNNEKSYTNNASMVDNIFSIWDSLLQVEPKFKDDIALAIAGIYDKCSLVAKKISGLTTFKCLLGFIDTLHAIIPEKQFLALTQSLLSYEINAKKDTSFRVSGESFGYYLLIWNILQSETILNGVKELQTELKQNLNNKEYDLTATYVKLTEKLILPDSFIKLYAYIMQDKTVVERKLEFDTLTPFLIQTIFFSPLIEDMTNEESGMMQIKIRGFHKVNELFIKKQNYIINSQLENVKSDMIDIVRLSQRECYKNYTKMWLLNILAFQIDKIDGKNNNHSYFIKSQFEKLNACKSRKEIGNCLKAMQSDLHLHLFDSDDDLIEVDVLFADFKELKKILSKIESSLFKDLQLIKTNETSSIVESKKSERVSKFRMGLKDMLSTKKPNSSEPIVKANSDDNNWMQNKKQTAPNSEPLVKANSDNNNTKERKKTKSEITSIINPMYQSKQTIEFSDKKFTIKKALLHADSFVRVEKKNEKEKRVGNLGDWKRLSKHTTNLTDFFDTNKNDKNQMLFNLNNRNNNNIQIGSNSEKIGNNIIFESNNNNNSNDSSDINDGSSSSSRNNK